MLRDVDGVFRLGDDEFAILLGVLSLRMQHGWQSGSGSLFSAFSIL